MRRAIIATVTFFSCGAAFLYIAAGCGMDGYFFTLGPCWLPGSCGNSGSFLVSQYFYVTEVSEAGRKAAYIPDLGGAVGGMAFERTADGVKFYVAVTPFGIYIQDAYEANPRSGIDYSLVPVSGCTMAGITLIAPQLLAAACVEEKKIVLIDLRTRAVEQLCALDASSNGADEFLPFAIAFDGVSTIVTGYTQVHAFDIQSGEPPGAVIPSGSYGATEFTDLTYGPDGHLYVSANPNIGVLVLDRVDYSLMRILVPGGIEGMPLLGPVTFSEDGRLFILSGETNDDGYILVEVDPTGGNVLRTILRPQESCCIGSKSRTNFLVRRP